MFDGESLCWKRHQLVAISDPDRDSVLRERILQGVVVVVVREGRLLMIRRAAGIAAGGSWCFVGGAIEPDETQCQAVVREFVEEVGGRVWAERKIWECSDQAGKLLLHWWLAKLDSSRLRPNPAEVAEIRWCSAEEFEALPLVLETNVRFFEAVGRRLIEMGTEERSA